MAAYWQPRSGGRTVQVLLGDGTVESSFERQGRAGRAAKLITQMGEQPPPSEPVLPQSWAAWYERVAAASGIDAAAVGAYPTTAAELPDSLAWLAESSWMTCAVDGVVLRAYAGRDSAAAVQRLGSWENGVWYIPAGKLNPRGLRCRYTARKPARPLLDLTLPESAVANPERVRHWRTVDWFGALKRNRSMLVMRPRQWPSRLTKPPQ